MANKQDIEGAAGPVDVELALRLLTTHRNGLAGKGGRHGRKPGVSTPDRTDESILRKLRALETMRRPATAVSAPAPNAAVALPAPTERG